MRRMWTSALVIAVAAMAPACAGDPKEGNETDGSGGTDSSNGTDGTDSSSGSSAGATSVGGVCEGIDCGGFGSCIEVGGEPRCACDTGYVEDPDVPTCTPSGGSASGSTSGTGGGSATTTSTSSTTSGSGGTTTATTGGGKPNGEPCQSPDECESGYCWSEWNWQQQDPFPAVCQEGCIQNEDYDSYCYGDGDCCNGQCQVGGQADGVCFN